MHDGELPRRDARSWSISEPRSRAQTWWRAMLSVLLTNLALAASHAPGLHNLPGPPVYRCVSKPYVQHSVVLLGPNVSTPTIATDAGACCSRCAATTGCGAWTWFEKPPHMCLLKAGNESGSRRDGSAYSGEPAPAPAPGPPPSPGPHPHPAPSPHPAPAAPDEATAVINTTSGASIAVPEYYLSVTQDAVEFRGSMMFDYCHNSSRCMALAHGLGSRGLLRVGGGDMDHAVFNRTIPADGRSVWFELLPDRLKKMVAFSNATGWRLVLGLNSMYGRAAGGAWDPTVSLEMLSYMQAQGANIFGVELGNEPDLYSFENHSITPPFKPTVAMTQLAADFGTLRGLLDSRGMQHVELLGPDLSSGRSGAIADLLEFSNAAADPRAPSMLTWHHYNGDAKGFYCGKADGKESCGPHELSNASLLDAWYNAKPWLDSFLRAAEPMRQAIALNGSAVTRQRPVYVGETSSLVSDAATGKWATPLFRSYAASAIWLDKLGLAASLGSTALFRQMFYCPGYCMVQGGVSKPDMIPTPDYWVSRLFLQTVGAAAFPVLGQTDRYNSFRAHGWCAQGGGIALIYLNARNISVHVNVSLTEGSLGDTRLEYRLTPGPDGQLESGVMLNGQLLTMGDDLSLPPMPPKEVAPSSGAQAGAYSSG